jgi:hypothetical protein
MGDMVEISPVENPLLTKWIRFDEDLAPLGRASSRQAKVFAYFFGFK